MGIPINSGIDSSLVALIRKAKTCFSYFHHFERVKRRKSQKEFMWSCVSKINDRRYVWILILFVSCFHVREMLRLMFIY